MVYYHCCDLVSPLLWVVNFHVLLYLYFHCHIVLTVNGYEAVRVANFTKAKYCGHFNTNPTNTSFDVYDREEQSAGLTVIHDSEFHEEFHSLRVQDGCQIKLCAIDFLSPKPMRKRVCYFFNSDTMLTDYLKFFYIVVVGCSCKEIQPECMKSSCQDVELLDNECVRMYSERNCQECNFDPYSLNTSSSFIPSNTFSVESFVVRNGCRLNIKSNATSENEQPEFSYKGIREFIQLSYVQKPHASLFSCVCGVEGSGNGTGTWGEASVEIEIEEGDESRNNGSTNKDHGNSTNVFVTSIETNNSTRNHEDTQIALGISLPMVIVVIFGLLYVVADYSLRVINGSENEQRAIEQFHVGNDDISGENSEGGISNYISLGYAKALKLPYQTKYEISRKNLKIDSTKSLGNGAFGNVFLGKLKSAKDESTTYTKFTLVAVKLAKSSPNETYFLSLLEEIKILAFIGSHPNIVGLVGACTDNISRRDALIILELCERGNLNKYLKDHKLTFLSNSEGGYDNPACDEIPTNSSGYAVLSISEQQTQYVTIKPEYLPCFVKWTIHIAAGMEYLSSMQVVHADLAARNVLLTDDLIAKISDFGLSKRIKDVENYVRIGDDQQCPLPFRSMAPESLISNRFSTHSDVWSYGVTLWEIFSFCEIPYSNIARHHHLEQFLISNQRLSKPLHSPNEIYNEMLKCWGPNPEERPSFTELRNFFESLDYV